jgi:AcrR family transcriptional regulator
MSKAPTELLQLYRRDQILSAARDVIRKNGFAHSSVDQIAKQAGVSRSTVYEYFASKSEILNGCLAVNRESLAEELAIRVGGAETLETQLAGFLEVCLSRVDQDREFFLAIAFPLPLDPATASAGPGGAAFGAVIEDFNAALDQILLSGEARGELPAAVGAAERNSLGTLIVGAMGTRCLISAPPPPAESAARLACFALRGLGGRK